MDLLQRIAHGVLAILAAIAALVLGVLDAVLGWLAGAMARIGIGGDLQRVVLILVAVLFLVGAFRLFGGLVRLALICILILLVAHLLGAFPHGDWVHA